MRPQFRRWILIILMWAAFAYLVFQAYHRGNTGLPFYVGVGLIAAALFWLTRGILRIPQRKR